MKEAKELKEKTLEQLYKDISEAQKKLREIRFKIVNREMKDTTEKLKTRKRIARILTIIREKEAEKLNKK